MKILKKTLDLMTSQQMEAFKVNKEPKEIQDAYGTSGFAKGCLMARRLVEAGVPFVEVDLGGWDNHAGIFPTLQNTKLPEMDKAMAALVQDLEQRGMLQDTAIIWMGEFSRTPRINGGAGRDHWPGAMTVLYAGGGLRMGQAIGTTNDKAEYPTSKPYSVGCVLSTMYHVLGVDHKHIFYDQANRPMAVLPEGKPIEELI